MGLSHAAQRVLLRANDHPNKTVTSGNSDIVMALTISGLASRGALTPKGVTVAARLRVQEHDLDPFDKHFAHLAPGHPGT